MFTPEINDIKFWALFFKILKCSEQCKMEREMLDSSGNYLALWGYLSVTWVYRRYTATLLFLKNLYLISDFFHSFYVNSGKEKKKERIYNCKNWNLKLIHLLYNLTPKRVLLAEWKFHQYFLNTLYNQGNKKVTARKCTKFIFSSNLLIYFGRRHFMHFMRQKFTEEVWFHIYPNATN